MADRLYFVQFPHPGSEHGPDPDDPSMKRWEDGMNAHKRKFMEAPGEWMDSLDAPPRQGHIRFWGEWEADSTVRPSGETAHGAPRWIHTPFFEGPERAPAGKVPQNTDPFVFGNRFLYTFCKQRIRKLRELAPGSVLLFGSKKDGAFVLDTVFVVADAVDHRRENYEQVAVPKSSSVFEETTLRPMYAWEHVNGGRLYRAAMARSGVSGMFSFVPCLPADEGGAFARPIIELGNFVNPKLGMSARSTAFESVEDLEPKWRAVVDQVLAQDLVLGVRIELPRARGAQA